MANAEYSSEQQPQDLDLDSLVLQSLTKFNAQETYDAGIHAEPPRLDAYEVWTAVADAFDLLEKQGVDMSNLATKLAKQSTAQPGVNLNEDEIDWRFHSQEDSWEKRILAVNRQIAERIVVNEVKKLHPEVTEEEERRYEKYNPDN